MKAREKLLLTLFLAMGLLAGVVVVGNLYGERREALVAERRDLDLERIEIEALLEDEELWTRRADLLSSRQPRFTTREEVDKAIFADARSGEEAGLVVSDVRLVEPAETPHYVQAGVALKVEGTVEEVFRWLHRLQKPETFRAVRSFKAVPHPDEHEKIVCDIELLRWYAR